MTLSPTRENLIGLAVSRLEPVGNDQLGEASAPVLTHCVAEGPLAASPSEALSTVTQRLILAASSGGHLEEMLRIAPRLGAQDDSLWVTPDTPQTASLLQGRHVLHVPDVPPRDPAAVMRAAWVFHRYLARHRDRYVGAVSTGAALAVAVLPVARALGLPARYIESFARFDGPSLTGRLLERVPGIRLTAQPEWQRKGWDYEPMLLDSFESHSVDAKPVTKVFVTVGTLDKYPFDALVPAIERTGITNPQTTWQIGTARRPRTGTVLSQVSVAEVDRLATEADVVVCHAGVGTLLRLWQLGVFPIIVPRRHARGEHVDDHQLQVAQLAHAHRLGLVREVSDLQRTDFQTAAAMRVRPSNTGDSVTHLHHGRKAPGAPVARHVLV